MGGDFRNQVYNAEYISKLLQARDIYGNIYFGDVEHLEPKQYPWDYQEYIRSVYVSNDQALFDLFEYGLRRRGYGYIVGPVGSGREAAAVAVLTSVRYSAHYVLVEAGEMGQFVRMPQRSRQGYIVDLSNLAEPFREVEGELVGFWQRARQKGSVVIVVMRPEQRGNDPLKSTPLETVAVPGIKVFASHLEHLSNEPVRPWEEHSGIADILRGATPVEAERLARIAADIHLRGEYATDEWIAETIRAHGGWEEHLDFWFGKNHSGSGVWYRLVLAACALLEGVDAGKVLESADQLAERLGMPPGSAGGFSGEGVDSTLRAVGAERDEHGAVCFVKYRYGAAVLDYYWEQHPRTRRYLFDWASDLYASLDHASVEVLAETWARLAIRQRDVEWASKAFNKWSREPRTLSAAVAFGARVSLSPSFGQRMRRRLYEIATEPSNPIQAKAVALVCRRLGKLNTASALVRLRRLARTDNVAVQEEILQTLDVLSEDRSVWSEITREISEWRRDDDEYRSMLATSFLFHQLSSPGGNGPRALDRIDFSGFIEPEDAHNLARMWSAIFDTADSSLVARAAEEWIPLALGASPHAEVVAEILVRGVAGSDSGPRSAVTTRAVTASHAIELWWRRNEEEFGSRQESVWSLQAWIVRTAAEIGSDRSGDGAG
ncbi:hypothetical protein ADL05_22890 [Nocardiopsis sp. NRRL B-16309]|nr:hypothetical protein ADL05_22890 [Nocardiopsis sp. NRRL B-16309]